MADHMAEDGFRDAGYEYISIDVSYEHCNFHFETVLSTRLKMRVHSTDSFIKTV